MRATRGDVNWSTQASLKWMKIQTNSNEISEPPDLPSAGATISRRKRTELAVIGQENDYTRPEDSTIGVSLGKGRETSSFPPGKLCLSFIGGLCADRTGLMVSKDLTRIGRGEDCDIILDGETVSRTHCEIVRRGSTYFLCDSSRNGTLVNGERVNHSALSDGDQLRIGQNLLLVQLTSGVKTSLITSKSTTPHRLPPVIELKPHIVVKGLEDGVTQPFSENSITIGRRADNHLPLEADNISRQHVAVERRDGCYFARDLGSVNGTYLNEQRIDLAQLSDGDRLRIGNYSISISLREQDCILNFKKITR